MSDDMAVREEPLNILVVNDQPENLLVMEAALLDLRNERLVTAASGYEALRHLLTTDFAVILLDVNMPGLNGFETAALIRDRPKCRNTPIIFLTASYKDNEGALLGYAAGGVDYISMPFDPFVLRSKVQVFLDLARKTELIRQQADLLRRANEDLEARVQLRTAQLSEANEALLELNADLERRVSERTADLEATNQELEAFTFSVSHDLRAPLRHVQGYIQMLARATDGQLTDKAQRYLKTVSEASSEMDHLIDDLLAFSRTSRADMKETVVDLEELVQETIRGLEMAAQGRNVTWKVAPLPRVMGDPAMLRQVLANLIGNALKYTRTRDPAQIEIDRAGEDDGRVACFIRDNGVGFDPQYAHKLFGVFQRLHRDDEFEGTGIGLATVRRIMHRHGGRVWAESELDRGATFYFSLKAA